MYKRQEEGDVMAVFPGQLHAIYGFEDQRMDYENIIFSLSLLMGAEEDLCTERFHFQRDYFNRLIRSKTGMTYSEYLQSCLLYTSRCV